MLTLITDLFDNRRGRGNIWRCPRGSTRGQRGNWRGRGNHHWNDKPRMQQQWRKRSERNDYNRKMKETKKNEEDKKEKTPKIEENKNEEKKEEEKESIETHMNELENVMKNVTVSNKKCHSYADVLKKK
ncbi:ATP-dependent rRNA helicase spb4 [Frankliniella fusca]|uniref:ATP-dependent rRNA helicase spb4 n=1 Tax=Frankliniella fusca TaxID=407009 RepID=A0AAE1L878_9NEOP|nr:ATP-dependent rRNA helicase spb4 [Frankliniella fusca]